MKFCNACDNMFYLSIDSSDCDKLMYYCRNCGVQDSVGVTDKSSVISSVRLSNAEINMSRIVNKYTKLDPTLPRIDSIPCPNSECGTNVEQIPRQIIYIRYDDINIKYMYLCHTCDRVWKANEA